MEDRKLCGAWREFHGNNDREVLLKRPGERRSRWELRVEGPLKENAPQCLAGGKGKLISLCA